MTKAPRKQLAMHGQRGGPWVRCFLETGHELVRVQWKLKEKPGIAGTESWPNTPANRAIAKAWAESAFKRLTAPVTEEELPRLTLRELWTKYLTAAEPHLRGKTITNYLSRWSKFELFAGRDAYADSITAETLDEFRQTMRRTVSRKTKRGHAVNQIAEHVKLVKQVFAWGRKRKLLRDNPLAEYTMKVAKDDIRVSTVEYSTDDWGKILSVLDYRSSRQWRGYVAVVLAGVLGPRQNALLHLEWAHVDLAARTVTWVPRWDKLGRERMQPLPRAAVRALRIAQVWRRRLGYEGPAVFPPVQARTKGGVWTYQALNQMLHEACERAGVAEAKYQAMHAFRRMAAGNVLELTGNLKQAGDWIGDTDLRVLAKSYLKHRPEQMRAVADRMDVPAHAAKSPRKGEALRNEVVTGEKETASDAEAPEAKSLSIKEIV